MAYTPYFSPQLLEMARTILRTPQTRPGEIAFAQAVLDEAARNEKLGSTREFPNGETGDRAPTPATPPSDGNNFLTGPPPHPRGIIPGFLGGDELKKLNQAMGVRPKGQPQFERLADGSFVTRHRTRDQRAEYASLHGIIRREGDK